MSLPRYRGPRSARQPLQAPNPPRRHVRKALLKLLFGFLGGGIFALCFTLGAFLARAISRGTSEAIRMLQDPSAIMSKGEFLWGLLLAGPLASVALSYVHGCLRRYKWFSEH